MGGQSSGSGDEGAGTGDCDRHTPNFARCTRSCGDTTDRLLAIGDRPLSSCNSIWARHNPGEQSQPQTEWEHLKKLALQQARLYQNVQQLNLDLESQMAERTLQLETSLRFEDLLRRIAERVRDSLDENQILETAVRELADGLHTCSCDTGLYDLESETEPLLLSTLELNDWLLHLAEPFVERMHQQQQQFLCKIPSELPSMTTDFSYLGRVISELLNNACKYTPANECIMHSVEIKFAEPCGFAMDYFQITVSNSGVEIPPEEQERVFERFYRIPNHDPWKYKGTGLGLALVEKLAEQIQGKITLTCHQGWTNFILQLPQRIHQTEIVQRER